MQRRFAVPQSGTALTRGLLWTAVVAPLWAGVATWPSQARVWRVERDGSGDFTAIQPAVDAAAPFDTVLVGAGRYTEHAPYAFRARTEDTYVAVHVPNLTLMGIDRDAVIIGPPNYDWPTQFEPNGIQTTGSAPGLTLEALTVENVPDGLGLQDFAVVRDCSFRQCRTAMPVFSVQPPRIERCEFVDCRECGIIATEADSGAVITGCRFKGLFPGLVLSQVGAAQIEQCRFTGGAGLQLQEHASATIRGCWFAGGGITLLDSRATLLENELGETAFVGLDVSGSSVIGQNNIFHGAQRATIQLRDASDAQLRGNQILNGGGWSVRVLGYSEPGHLLDLRDNWWGSPYADDVAAWIYDGDDDARTHATVEYGPLAPGPIAAASAPPTTTATLDQP